MPKEFNPEDDERDENNDDENGDFDAEDFSNELDYDDDEPLSIEEFRKERDAYREMPLFKSAERISQLTFAIVETFDDEKDQLMLKNQMIENALIIGAKIAGAEGAGLYTLKMENAVIIKINARELLANTSLCKELKLCSKEYLKLLRDEIEEFRKLFVEWVKSFNKTDDVPDDWGLFYD